MNAETKSTERPEEVLQKWDRGKFRVSPHSDRSRVGRLVWSIAYQSLFRFSPRPFHGWRRFVLKMFGAKMGRGSRVYPSVRILAPWNLTVGEMSVLGDRVDCYCVGKVIIGDFTTISQDAVLCGATHDHTLLHFPLVIDPIHIADYVWVGAGVFIMPGVTVQEGAVIGVRSLVTKDVPAWVIAVGSPCKAISSRKVKLSEP